MKFNHEEFIALGYNLNDFDNAPSFRLSNFDMHDYQDISVEELVKMGDALLTDYFNNQYEQGKLENIILPLSGGNDSRLLLNYLLKFKEASSFSTYTFGIPGSLDFEIGNRVGKYYCRNHSSINIYNYSYSLDGLIEYGRRTFWKTGLFNSIPIELLDTTIAGRTVLSGFMGDVVTGGHYGDTTAETDIDSEYKKFLLSNVRKNWQEDGNELYELFLKDYSLDYDWSNASNSRISFKEQLDLGIREVHQVYPHVLVGGFDYLLPFIDKEIFSFFISLENSLRENQKFYREFCNQFDSFKRFGVKDRAGFSVVSSKHVAKLRLKLNQLIGGRMELNYIDYARAFTKGDLFKIKQDILSTYNEKNYSKDVNRIVTNVVNGKYQDKFGLKNKVILSFLLKDSFA